MRRISLALTVPTLIAAALLAGCGSASKSSSSASNAPASSTPASTTAAAGGAGNPYGSSATSASATGAAPSTSGAAAVVVATKQTKMGTVLAGRKHLTLYLFEADTPGRSACTGACASVWPPVVGSARAAGKATSADLGTITRSDGTKQVTYKGHPLYYFAKDGDSGDTYGQGIKSFGASWYVLSPSGTKIDNS